MRVEKKNDGKRGWKDIASYFTSLFSSFMEYSQAAVVWNAFNKRNEKKTNHKRGWKGINNTTNKKQKRNNDVNPLEERQEKADADLDKLFDGRSKNKEATDSQKDDDKEANDDCEELSRDDKVSVYNYNDKDYVFEMCISDYFKCRESSYKMSPTNMDELDYSLACDRIYDVWSNKHRNLEEFEEDNNSYRMDFILEDDKEARYLGRLIDFYERVHGNFDTKNTIVQLILVELGLRNNHYKRVGPCSHKFIKFAVI